MQTGILQEGLGLLSQQLEDNARLLAKEAHSCLSAELLDQPAKDSQLLWPNLLLLMPLEVSCQWVDITFTASINHQADHDRKEQPAKQHASRPDLFPQQLQQQLQHGGLRFDAKTEHGSVSRQCNVKEHELQEGLNLATALPPAAAYNGDITAPQKAKRTSTPEVSTSNTQPPKEPNKAKESDSNSSMEELTLAARIRLDQQATNRTEESAKKRKVASLRQPHISPGYGGVQQQQQQKQQTVETVGGLPFSELLQSQQIQGEHGNLQEEPLHEFDDVPLAKRIKHHAASHQRKPHLSADVINMQQHRTPLNDPQAPDQHKQQECDTSTITSNGNATGKHQPSSPVASQQDHPEDGSMQGVMHTAPATNIPLPHQASEQPAESTHVFNTSRSSYDIPEVAPEQDPAQNTDHEHVQGHPATEFTTETFATPNPRQPPHSAIHQPGHDRCNEDHDGSSMKETPSQKSTPEPQAQAETHFEEQGAQQESSKDDVGHERSDNDSQGQQQDADLGQHEEAIPMPDVKPNDKQQTAEQDILQHEQAVDEQPSSMEDDVVVGRPAVPVDVQQRVAARLAEHQAAEQASLQEAERREAARAKMRDKLQQRHGEDISRNNVVRFLINIGIRVSDHTPRKQALSKCSIPEAQAALRKAVRAARVLYHPDKVQQQLRAAQAAYQQELQRAHTAEASATGKGASSGRGVKGRKRGDPVAAAAAKEQEALEQLVWAEEVCKVLNAFDLGKVRY